MSNKYSNRYSVPEDESFEPGSNDSVLRNFLGIKSKTQMDAIEEQELKRTEMELLSIFSENHQFTAENICHIHELWLGDIYPFAGKYRTVNMSKSDFTFAPAARIEILMNQFEAKFLSNYTPCDYSDADKLALGLGIVHVEFILIHPFREGNGRTARLVSDLMVMQSKKPPLNYSSIDQIKNRNNFTKYVQAIHAGLGENYDPIQQIFRELLEQSTI